MKAATLAAALTTQQATGAPTQTTPYPISLTPALRSRRYAAVPVSAWPWFSQSDAAGVYLGRQRCPENIRSEAGRRAW
jgi:hypothetical protein